MLLVPDLAAYTLTSPHARPGLAERRGTPPLIRYREGMIFRLLFRPVVLGLQRAVAVVFLY